MSAHSSTAWAIWLVIGVMLAVCIGLIVWFIVASMTAPKNPELVICCPEI